MSTVAIFGDKPDASTGFAVVLSNLAEELTKFFRVIYFGRFGQEKEFATETRLLPGFKFEYVPCQGGVWDRELVIRILDHYKEVDYVFSEDDWFSAEGLVGACEFCGKPFHLLTPIDSLPIHPRAFSDVFTRCDKVYIPNRSFASLPNKRLLLGDDHVIKRQGMTVKYIYLPHGVRGEVFKPRTVDRSEKFTLLWFGRIEQRKAPARLIKAYELIQDKMDSELYIRSDWTTPVGKRFFDYIIRKDLSVIVDQMKDMPHEGVAPYYNMGDIYISTAMAGGFEMGIIEAAASQVPSAVTDWTFMNEHVINGKTGWLIPCSSFTYPTMGDHAEIAKYRVWGRIDINKLAERMYYAYLNQEELRAMGRVARDFVTTRYKWDEIAKVLAREIEE